jgi:hypothetical protein
MGASSLESVSQIRKGVGEMINYTYTYGSEVAVFEEDVNPVCIDWLYYYAPAESTLLDLFKVVAMNSKYVVLHEQTTGVYWGYKNSDYTRPILVKLKEFKKTAVRLV